MELKPRLWRPLLIFLIFLSLALRVYKLDSFSFWQDEGLTALRSGYSISEILSNRITIQEGITKDTHPPAYYLVAHLAMNLLGDSDFSYRLTSVFAGVLLVPLLFQLGRRVSGPVTGLLAALLATLNPLQVWYAQEARMYTMLALLGAAASYILWRAITRPNLATPALFARMAAYFVVAGIAFYTHYTAAFLIAAQSLFWVWLLWRRGLKFWILGAALVGLLAAIPLIPTTIPRLFTGAETAYYYVSPWIMLQDVVHGFGQGLTAHFDRFGIKLLDVALLALLLLGLLATRKDEDDGWLGRLFLLVYLLAAVVGLMAGSLLKPMYLGVRHIIIGSPAFIILIARGVSALPSKPGRIPQALALALVTGASVLSLINLYYDPSFAKDEARSLVQHIEARAGSSDVVVHNNAIILPLHEHYAQRDDLPVTAIPVYPHMAGDQIGDQIAALAEQYDRIWFVADKPIDGRDEERLVSAWLEENLSRLESAGFWGVSMNNQVIAYDADPAYIAELPQTAHSVSTSWEDLPILQGFSIKDQDPLTLLTLWLDLFWESPDQVDSELQLRFTLQDVEGLPWLDVSYPFRQLNGPTSAGDALERHSYGLSIPAGLPPGEYDLLIQPWDESSGAALGSSVPLTSIHVSPSDLESAELDWPFVDSAALTFNNGLTLLGIVPVSESVRPGHPMPLNLYWQAQVSADVSPDLEYLVEVVSSDGSVVHSHRAKPGPNWLPIDQWPEETVILEQGGVYLPPEAVPGRYRLRWTLLSGEDPVPGRLSWRPWAADSNYLGAVNVVPWPIDKTLPQSGNIVEADFGPDIQLYSYEMGQTGYAPGQELFLTLYWQALDVPDDSYLVFVHLLSPDGQEIVAQSDKIPVDWLRPTNGWRKGEVLQDPHVLQLPEYLEPGAYDLFVGLYNPDAELRLPITIRGERQADDRLPLDPIIVTPEG